MREPLPPNPQRLGGGNNRARTCDPLLVRQVLSQLSYAPAPAHARLTYNTTSGRVCQDIFQWKLRPEGKFFAEIFKGMWQTPRQPLRRGACRYSLRAFFRPHGVAFAQRPRRDECLRERRYLRDCPPLSPQHSSLHSQSVSPQNVVSFILGSTTASMCL